MYLAVNLGSQDLHINYIPNSAYASYLNDIPYYHVALSVVLALSLSWSLVHTAHRQTSHWLCRSVCLLQFQQAAAYTGRVAQLLIFNEHTLDINFSTRFCPICFVSDERVGVWGEVKCTWPVTDLSEPEHRPLIRQLFVCLFNKLWRSFEISDIVLQSQQCPCIN